MEDREYEERVLRFDERREFAKGESDDALPQYPDANQK